MKIVDETQPKTFSIMFYAETVDKIPQVASNGDIILVSQVKGEILVRKNLRLINLHENFHSENKTRGLSRG